MAMLAIQPTNPYTAICPADFGLKPSDFVGCSVVGSMKEWRFTILTELFGAC
jgi:hypothetical protein